MKAKVTIVGPKGKHVVSTGNDEEAAVEFEGKVCFASNCIGFYPTIEDHELIVNCGLFDSELKGICVSERGVISATRCDECVKVCGS